MNDKAGRENPQLPQHASPDDQEARARDIGSARKTYVWTTQVTTLPGVPLATTVPFADQPNIPWLLETVEVALAIAKNVLANKLAEGEANLSKEERELAKIIESFESIRDHHASATESADGIRHWFAAATEELGLLFGRHRVMLGEHLDDVKTMIDANRLGPKAARDLAAFEGLFKTLPLPAIAKTFMDDATFARMRVAGPNAGLIEGIEQLPTNFPVTDAQYQSVMGTSDDLATAGHEGRLYLLDYASLASMVPGLSNGKQKYLWCPLALFAVPRGEQSLVPVAIQCTQDPSQGGVFVRPAACGEWAWEMAKFVVQVADGNYHELFAHLARTHLVIETFAVANHRALAPQHPLYLLLIAHTEGTLFINNSASGSLIAAGGPIEAIFAGTIDTIQLAAANDRLAFDFYERMLPRDLARRNVTNVAGLPDYPYRDDALMVWGALEAWIRAYVGVYYSTDADVIGDTELAAFCAEVRGAGRMKGFAVIETIDQLVEVLTMIVFTGSAQHAAVNFPQQTDMTYVPNITGAGWAPGPDESESSEAAWIAMMPTLDLALEQLNTLWLLGGVHFRKLGDYLATDFPYHAWFLDERITRDGGPLERFRTDLRVVEAEIERANTKRAVAYTFLQPSLVPESINI